ncbi:MAG TPA: hypothetical protein PKA95_05365 [Thermomicrobiales bacterium]|nr:hypothetical protein [Thermomicrobiales bacterium]
MDDQGSGFPSWLLLLAPLAIVGIIWMMRRSSSETRVDKAMKPISRAIDDSELPDRAKSMLLNTVDEVRQALNTIGSTASEMAER